MTFFMTTSNYCYQRPAKANFINQDLEWILKAKTTNYELQIVILTVPLLSLLIFNIFRVGILVNI